MRRAQLTKVIMPFLTYWCFVSLVVLILAQPATGFVVSGNSSIVLVNHRDANGNLVWPQKPRRSIVQKTVVPAQPRRSTLQSRWEMSAAEVRELESATLAWEVRTPVLHKGELRLGYETSVAGLSAFLTYTLVDDRLQAMKYLFDMPYDDAEDYLQDYETVKKWIVQTYGEPVLEEYLWLDTLYQYAPELWNKAVMRGHLTVVCEWKTKDTSITLLLNGGDDTIGLLASLTSLNGSAQIHMVSLPVRLMGL